MLVKKLISQVYMCTCMDQHIFFLAYTHIYNNYTLIGSEAIWYMECVQEYACISFQMSTPQPIKVRIKRSPPTRQRLKKRPVAMRRSCSAPNLLNEDYTSKKSRKPPVQSEYLPGVLERLFMGTKYQGWLNAHV